MVCDLQMHLEWVQCLGLCDGPILGPTGSMSNSSHQQSFELNLKVIRSSSDCHLETLDKSSMYNHTPDLFVEDKLVISALLWTLC